MTRPAHVPEGVCLTLVWLLQYHKQNTEKLWNMGKVWNCNITDTMNMQEILLRRKNIPKNRFSLPLLWKLWIIRARFQQHRAVLLSRPFKRKMEWAEIGTISSTEYIPPLKLLFHNSICGYVYSSVHNFQGILQLVNAQVKNIFLSFQ